MVVELEVAGGERLPFADAAFDCVVSTFTLCSVDDVPRALAEAYRVLRPGGRLLFLEHGLSPEPGVRQWQHRLNALQRLLGGGCRLDRDFRALVAGSPFGPADVREFDLEKTPRRPVPLATTRDFQIKITYSATDLDNSIVGRSVSPTLIFTASG